MVLQDQPDPGLARVSEETGGGYAEIRGGEDLGYAFEGVLDELHTQYLLAFAPPEARRQSSRHQRPGDSRPGEAARAEKLPRAEGVGSASTAFSAGSDSGVRTRGPDYETDLPAAKRCRRVREPSPSL